MKRTPTVRVTATRRDRRGPLYKVERPGVPEQTGWVPARYVYRLLSKRPFEGVTRRRGTLWSRTWKPLQRLSRGTRVQGLRKVRDNRNTLYEVRHGKATGWMNASYVRFVRWTPRRPKGPSPAALRRRQEAARRHAAAAERRRVAGIQRQANEEMRRTIGLLETGAGPWDYARSAGGAIADVAQKGYQWVKNKGIAYVVGILKKIWHKVKHGCEALAGKLGRWASPIAWVSSTAGHCAAEIAKGFFCGIPEEIEKLLGLGKMLWEVAREAIGHRVCWASVVVPGAPFFCGFSYWIAGKVRRMTRCFRSLGAGGTLKLLARSLWQESCKTAGEMLKDSVVAALTGGGTLAPTVMKWVNRIFGSWAPDKILNLLSRSDDVLRKFRGYLHRANEALSLPNQLEHLTGRELAEVQKHALKFVKGVAGSTVKGACK